MCTYVIVTCRIKLYESSVVHLTGNDLIHLLTTSYNNSLQIRMKKVGHDGFYQAHYSLFSISSEADGYRLHLGVFSGSIGMYYFY